MVLAGEAAFGCTGQPVNPLVTGIFLLFPLQLFSAFRVYKQHTIAWRRLCDVNTLIYHRRTAASKSAFISSST